jgi:predicted AAA+ superfamily ATPase
VGRTFSAASITKYLKNEQRSIDNETVYNYLSKLESAFILPRCSRFDIQGKEILKTQEKFFLSDPAFRYSVLGYTPDSVAAMLENLVYLELLRRGYEVTIGKLDNAEIDFVATKQENKLYIQITERIEREETQQREYGSFSVSQTITPNMYSLQMNSQAAIIRALKPCTLRISC